MTSIAGCNYRRCQAAWPLFGYRNDCSVGDIVILIFYDCIVKRNMDCFPLLRRCLASFCPLWWDCAVFSAHASSHWDSVYTMIQQS